MGANCDLKKSLTFLSEDERQNIFKNFWEMANYNLQNSYRFCCLEVKKKKTDAVQNQRITNQGVYYQKIQKYKCVRSFYFEWTWQHGLQKKIEEE